MTGRAHDREHPIRCGDHDAVAVFFHGSVICARCGERLTMLHDSELLAAAAGRDADVLQWRGAGGANGSSELGPSAA